MALRDDAYALMLEALDGEWRDLRELVEARMGMILSGSAWESVADRLVERGQAELGRYPEVEQAKCAPMGKVYRKAAR